MKRLAGFVGGLSALEMAVCGVQGGGGGGGPAPPPFAADLAAWWHAGAGTYQDGGTTVPTAAHGDPVGGWEDQSGNGHTFRQFTGGRLPLWQEGVLGGLPGLLFDGDLDYLICGTAVTLGTALAVVRYDAAAFVNYSTILAALSIASGSDYLLIGDAGTANLATFGGFGASIRVDGVNTASAAPLTSFHVVSGHAAPFTKSALGVGWDETFTARCWDGHIVEVLLYATELTGGDLEAAEGYLADKYGL